MMSRAASSWNEAKDSAREREARTSWLLGEVELGERRLNTNKRQIGTCITETDRIRSALSELARATESVFDNAGGTIEALAASPDGASEPRSATWRASSVMLESGVQFQILTDPEAGDPISDELAQGGTSNQPLLALIHRLLKPGEKFLDLGCHVGTFALAAAAAGSPALAVDASADNVALLRASTALNVFDNVLTVHAAVGDTPGSVAFLSHGPWGQVLVDGFPGTEQVPCITVAELVQELNWRPLGVVKIDVEGYELRTFDGMAGLLSGPDAPFVVYESNAHTLAQQGVKPADLIGHLAGLGYSSYLIDRPRLIHTTADDLQAQTVVDYLAVKRFPTELLEDGWEIVTEMSFDERVRRIVAECNDPDPVHRSYIRDLMAGADAELRAQPDVQAALATSAGDE